MTAILEKQNPSQGVMGLIEDSVAGRGLHRSGVFSNVYAEDRV